MAGVLGLDYRPFSYRALAVMYQAQQLETWDHTAVIVAKIHNANCTKKSQLVKPATEHPYRRHGNGGSIRVGGTKHVKLLAAVN